MPNYCSAKIVPTIYDHCESKDKVQFMIIIICRKEIKERVDAQINELTSMGFYNITLHDVHPSKCQLTKNMSTTWSEKSLVEIY